MIRQTKFFKFMLEVENKFVLLVMKLRDFTKKLLRFHAQGSTHLCNAGHEIKRFQK